MSKTHITSTGRTVYPEATIERLNSLINEHLRNQPTIGSDDIEQMLAHILDLPWSKGLSFTDVPRYPKDWQGVRSSIGYSVKKSVKDNPFNVEAVSAKLTTRFNIPQILSGQGFQNPTEVGEAFLGQWAELVRDEKKIYPDHRTIVFLFNPTHTKLVIHEEPTQSWNYRNYRWEYSDATKRNIHGYLGGKKVFSIQLNDNRLHRRFDLTNRLLIDLRTKVVTSEVIPVQREDEAAQVMTLYTILG
jgi:hypothetical protein